MRTKHKQKMWLVKREVITGTIREAMTKPGRIYEIQEAGDKSHPVEPKPTVGFKSKSK